MMQRILFIALLLGRLFAVDDWMEPAAAWRFVAARVAGDEDKVQVGHLRLWPQEPSEGELQVAIWQGDRRLGSEILWQAAGDPIDVLFEVGHRREPIHCYLGTGLSAAPDWQPKAGLTIESRDLPSGVDIESAESIEAGWQRADVIRGRSLAEQIFHGFDPHGVSEQCMLRFRGWLRIRNPGQHRFATVSDDASILRIDGQEVASWLGWHGPHAGLRGRYDGRVKLGAGLHEIDYLLVQGSGGMCAEAAWQPPQAEHLRLLEAEAFARIGRFDVRSAQHREGKAGTMLTWEPKAHAISGRHQLVAMHFSSQPPLKKLRWQSDDGASLPGAQGNHVFLRPGLHDMRVLMPDGERQLRIAVRRRWDDRVEWTEKRSERLWQEALDRDLAALPIVDLLAAIDWAEHLEDDDARHRLADVLLKRLDEVPSAGEEALRSVYALAFALQDQHLRRFQDAANILDVLAGWQQTPARLRAQARLHMAGNLIHHLDNAQAGEALLAGIDEEQLDEGEGRLRQIFLGDAALYRHKVELARERYREAGTVVESGDLHFAARRRARLEAAKDYLRRDEFDAAERIVHEIQWETPIERLGSECTLLLNAIRLARGDHRTARLHLEAFLAVTIDDPRESELLLMLVRAGLAEGAQQLAASTAERLRRDHPYSEAAVRVADLIGVQQ